MLTSYSDPDRMRPDLYYGDPCRLFDHCKRRYSRHVALLHDYGLYEFTILVRLDAEISVVIPVYRCTACSAAADLTASRPAALKLLGETFEILFVDDRGLVDGAWRRDLRACATATCACAGSG